MTFSQKLQFLFLRIVHAHFIGCTGSLHINVRKIYTFQTEKQNNLYCACEIPKVEKEEEDFGLTLFCS